MDQPLDEKADPLSQTYPLGQSNLSVRYGAGQVESEGADRDAKDAYEAGGQCPTEHVDGFDHRRAG